MIKRKAVLYYRVSTTSEEQDVSFQTQSKYNSDDYNIVARYGDKKTATHIKGRKQFQQMLYDCNIDIEEIKGNTIFSVGDRQPIANLILVSHTSRFMRNQLLMKQLLKTLEKANVEVIFLDMGKSSFDSDIDFVLNILFLLDEQESKNTSFKVKNGLVKAREQRQYLHYGYGRMLGFDYDKENNRLLKNDDAEIIVNIFNDYKGGLSVRKVAEKYGYNQNKILRIIQNEKYCGYNAYHKYSSDKFEGKKIRNKEYDIFPSNRIEPIISYELWKECQEIRMSRKCGNRGVNTKTYPLSSKIKCSKCGGNFFHHDKKGGYSSWKCLNKHNNNSCDIPAINENTILKHLKSIYGLQALKNGFEFRIESAIYDLNEIEDVFIVKNKIKPLESRIERLKKLYIMGDIEEDEYLEKKEIFINELKEYKETIEQIQQKERTIKELEELKSNYLLIFKELEELLEENKKDEIFERVSYIEVDEIYDVIKLNKKKAYVKKVVFKDFLPVEKYITWIP